MERTAVITNSAFTLKLEKEKSPQESGHKSLSFVINPARMTQVNNLSAVSSITLRGQLFRSPTGSMAQAELRGKTGNTAVVTDEVGYIAASLYDEFSDLLIVR